MWLFGYEVGATRAASAPPRPLARPAPRGRPRPRPSCSILRLVHISLEINARVVSGPPRAPRERTAGPDP